MKKYFSNSINLNSRRVVVTGMGMVSPLGNNTQESWENLINLRSGIRSLENEEYVKDLPKNCKIGAPINKNFDGKKYRTLGTDNFLNQMTMSAADEAIKDANLTFDDKRQSYRTV